MVDALSKTMYHLAHTRNQAAVSVLASALASTRLEIRLGAIHGLVVRRNPEGHSQILARFPTFNDDELAELASSLIRSQHKMLSTLRDVMLSEDQRLCETACRVILMGRVYPIIPTLVQVAEDHNHRHSQQALATLVQLASLLHEESFARGEEKTCDPGIVRRQILPPLEASVVRFSEHRRLEIIDAFLLVVPPSNETLLKILRERSHPCHRPVLDSLSTSALVPILDLLTRLLHDTEIPAAALKTIGARLDRKFLDYLLHHIGWPVSLRVLENFRQLSKVGWLEDRREVLLDLDGRAQRVAIEIAKSGCVTRQTYLTLLKFLLQHGAPEGRRAACEALAEFHDRATDQLIAITLQDPDPRVQAAAVRQLRERGFHDAMERLVGLLDHRAPEVRDAARTSLAEFNYSRYRSVFDSIDDESREKIGRLVGKVDPTAYQRLAEDLSSPALSTKLRALEMTQAMNAADEVFDRLSQLINDPDVGVRAETVAALGLCDRDEAIPLLYEVEKDVSLSVREAAQRSIDQIADRSVAGKKTELRKSEGWLG
ncbi:MAG: HEAT repeat domain-containing protein [Pirellulales bacterium]